MSLKKLQKALEFFSDLRGWLPFRHAADLHLARRDSKLQLRAGRLSRGHHDLVGPGPRKDFEIP